MQPVAFPPPGAPDPVMLVFAAGNDRDSEPTHFWVDAVRFCVVEKDFSHGIFIPYFRR
jgi:hypothetical protein